MDKAQILEIAEEHGLLFALDIAAPSTSTADLLAFAARIEALALERAAQVALGAALYPPDGGAPTINEVEVAEEAARRIRALNPKQ